MFWIGLLAGAVLTLAVVWLYGKQLSIKWYEWLIGILAVSSLFATVQHYAGSMGENEPTSAWMGALIFGVLTVILGLITWQLIARHQKA